MLCYSVWAGDFILFGIDGCDAKCQTKNAL